MIRILDTKTRNFQNKFQYYLNLRRKYSDSKSFPRILNGLGVSIVSTSKGLMTGKKAKSMNLGGELICYIY